MLLYAISLPVNGKALAVVCIGDEERIPEPGYLEVVFYRYKVRPSLHRQVWKDGLREIKRIIEEKQ